jgi:hypothetical protein
MEFHAVACVPNALVMAEANAEGSLSVECELPSDHARAVSAWFPCVRRK